MKEDKKVGALGIIALVLGAISLVMSWTLIIGIICGILGIVLGIIDLVKKNKIACPIIGIVLSTIGIATALVIFTVVSVFVKDNKEIIIDELDKKASQIQNIETKDKKTSKIQNKESNDEISNNSFVNLSENSLLDLKSNGTYIYYKSQYDLSDNFKEGTYQVYKGEKAVEYIANELKEYGLTEEVQREILTTSSDCSIENYYCLILISDMFIIDGEYTEGSHEKIPYVGFYSKSTGELGLTNLSTAAYVYFVKK